MEDYIVGMDISSSKVCGVVGRLDDDNEVQISGVTTSDYNGLSENENDSRDEIAYVIKGVLNRLEEIVGTSLKKVYVSLPVSMCEIVSTKGVVSFPEVKEISKEDIENVCEVAKFSVGREKEIVKVHIEEYIVDDMHNISNPTGIKGKILQSEGTAFILSSKYVDVYRNWFKKIDVEIEGWVINSIGMAKDVLDEQELEDGVALIDAGNTDVEVSVFNKGKFVDFLSIPLGGKNITNDISVCLKLPVADSERLKVKCNTLLTDLSMENSRIKINTVDGQAVEVNQELMVDVVRERVKELLELVDKKIKSEGLDRNIKSYVIVGGGIALFRDITLLAKDVLGKSVRVGIPNYVGAANPVYATATGILNYVLKKQLIFLDEKQEKENIVLEEEHSHKKENKIVTMIKGILKGISNEEVTK